MALQVWLPLNGDYNNYGLSGLLNFTETGTVSNVDGKIGKCKLFSLSNVIAPYSYTLGTEFSICAWVNWTAFPSSSSNDWIVHIATTSNYANAVVGLSCYHGTLLCVMAGGRNDYTYTHNFSTNTWYHIAFTWKNTGNSYLYINGLLVKTYTNMTGGTVKSADKISLGSNVVNSSTKFKGKLNDIRFYDHCLSPKEVKEISKGLVLHYKLDPLSGSGYKVNLVENGWGGTNNWTSNTSSTVSTVVPSNVTGITNSYSSNNTTKTFIPIFQSHSYSVSCYGSKQSSTSTNWYLSLIPYDIDKLRINVEMTPVCFKSSSLTTLAQDLNTNDTVIHLTSTLGWDSFSTYLYIVAIFGYTDSTGYTYPDLTYTRRILTFGTSTDKSNVDLVNKTVTLRSAYTGSKIPAGTSICVTGYGSTYYYPLSNSVSSWVANEWYYRSTTFVPKNVPFLKVAKYVKVIASINTTWTAGITLIDNTISQNVLDCSGYENDGIIEGSLTLSSDTPRYNYDTIFNRTSYIYKTPLDCSSEIKTISFWANWDTFTGGANNQSVLFVDNGTKTGFGLMSTGILLTTSGAGNSYIYSKSNLSINTWYHFVIIITGATTRDLYINGIKQTPTSNTSNWTYSVNQLQIGKRSTTADGFNGKMSDFRMYTTALSDEDIKELYNTSAVVDNNLNIGCFLLEESIEDIVNIMKTGVITCNSITEDNLASIYDDGDITCNQLIEI